MVGYRILGEDESESLKQSKYSRFRSIMDFKSIFTYSAQSDPLNDKGNSANNMTEYYSVPKDDVEYSKFETAFDYKSIFSYSNGSNKKNGKAKTQDYDASSTDESPPNDNVDVVISNIILMCSYVLVFFTLPISVWFCFKHLPQWERIVVYRIGKLHGVLGPGNIFVIPWLDTLTKLDLRTQLISHPTTQFLTKDHAILEAGCNIYYRICDPIKYTGSVCDPEFQGFKKISAAISLKHMESLDVRREFQANERLPCEEQIQKELNVITTPWGVEISSVEIEGFRVFKAAPEPANAFMNMMQQMGMDPTSNGVAKPTIFDPLIHASNVAECALKSENAIKLQSIFDEAIESIEDGLIIRFKIGDEPEFYADFSSGRGEVHENVCPGRIDVTLSLSQSLFHSLIDGASQAQFFQAYLTGQITIDGNMEALRQLQKLLPNLQTL